MALVDLPCAVKEITVTLYACKEAVRKVRDPAGKYCKYRGRCHGSGEFRY